MIRADLEKAGIPYEDGGGRVYDFHGLRHQFISDLVAAGHPPKVVQELARHSTITLTMDRYAHIDREPQQAALESLPVLNLTVDLTVEDSSDSADTSPIVTLGGEVTSPVPSSQPLVASPLSDGCPDLSAIDMSSGAGTRTPDTRIMIPLL
jgi:hypothetical protein